MASALQGLEEGSTDDYELVPNTTPTDELAAVQALARGPGEVMTIQTLQRFCNPVLIRQIVDEQIVLRNQEFLASMKENTANEATTSVHKRLKLQFRNKISVPVFTGKPLLGENKTSIEIALVDAFTNQIMNTGIESTAKLEIVGFRVGDNGRIDDSWTFKEFQEMIMSERKRKRILQGETCLQLKKGVCILSKISFTHTSENTKNGWYRLGAGVVDAALMHRVEVAKTDAFLIKDGRTTYSEKRPHPRLSDKVCHLHHISYKGDRYKRLKVAGVFTVKDLLTLLYTNPKGLQDILKVRDSSNIWGDIVKNAQASNGMFLFLDSSSEEKTGVVLDAKLQLKGLIAEPHKYVPVDQLSAKQKVDSTILVKSATEHFRTLQSFEDETSFKKDLMSCTSFSSLPSANQCLGTSNMIDEPITETPHKLNESNLEVGQCTTHTPIVTSPYEWGKAMVSSDNDMDSIMNYLQEDMPPHLLNTESPYGLSFGNIESTLNAWGQMNNSNVSPQCMDNLINSPDSFEELSRFLNHDSVNSDADVMMVATRTVSIGPIGRARSRWTVMFNLVSTMIFFKHRIRALKRQRCC